MDIKVNAGEWNGLDQDVRDKITAIIARSFNEQHKIVADAGTPASATRTFGEKSVQSFLSNPLCTAACSVAEAGAVAACSAVSGGIATAVCIAAAHEAGNYCRSRC